MYILNQSKLSDLEGKRSRTPKREGGGKPYKYDYLPEIRKECHLDDQYRNWHILEKKEDISKKKKIESI